MNKSLEQEINESTERINKRNTEYEIKVVELEGSITTYTKWAWIFVWVGFLIGVIGLIFFIVSGSDNVYSLNLLGDFYGGTVASLWSLAGLFFIYVAFLGQKQQLLNQQIEIMYSQLEVKYTRLELEGQKKEMIEQNKTLRQQRFENTFFQLLRNHQEIVNAIDLRKATNMTLQGRDCFRHFNDKFNESVGNTLGDIKGIAHTIKGYMKFYDVNQANLGHYFRHMYRILKFIDESEEISDTEKYKYSNFLRALLSSYELVLIFYNGLGDYGKEKFKPLIEKYSILKNLDWKLLKNQKDVEEYQKLAFLGSAKRKELLQAGSKGD
jgi:hypothetical protein